SLRQEDLPRLDPPTQQVDQSKRGQEYERCPEKLHQRERQKLVLLLKHSLTELDHAGAEGDDERQPEHALWAGTEWQEGYPGSQNGEQLKSEERPKVRPKVQTPMANDVDTVESGCEGLRDDGHQRKGERVL